MQAVLVGSPSGFVVFFFLFFFSLWSMMDIHVDCLWSPFLQTLLFYKQSSINKIIKKKK